MRFGYQFAIAACLQLVGAAYARAQDAAVNAEKQAPIKSILPGAYLKMEVRHSVARRMESTDVTNDVPKIDVRPTIGSAFFDGKLDTSFTWIFRKTAETAKVTKLIMFNESKWSVFQTPNVDIGPYAVIYQSHDQSFSEAYVGLDASLKKDVTIAGGVLALSGYIEPLAVLHSGKSAAETRVNVRNETGNEAFALDSKGATDMEQRDATIWNFSAIEARMKPDAVKGAYLGLGIELSQKWDPKYAAKSADGDTRVEKSGYAATAVTTNVFRLGYKVSDSLTLAGAIRQNIGGYYDQGVGESRPDPTGYWAATRWESRLALQATLF